MRRVCAAVCVYIGTYVAYEIAVVLKLLHSFSKKKKWGVCYGLYNVKILVLIFAVNWLLYKETWFVHLINCNYLQKNQKDSKRCEIKNKGSSLR